MRLPALTPALTQGHRPPGARPVPDLSPPPPRHHETRVTEERGGSRRGLGGRRWLGLRY